MLSLLEAYVYPMHGATRLISKDFDQDGDLDIAVSAYFPDFKADELRSFVYLKNTSTDTLSFVSRTLAGPDAGRWLFLDTIVRPGQTAPGIVLGASNLGLERRSKNTAEQWSTNSIDLIILDAMDKYDQSN